MSPTYYAPVIFVNDIESSMNFYQNALGQEIEHNFGKNIIFKSRISLWEIDPESEINRVKGNSRDGNTFELYFETSDIEDTLLRLKAFNIDLLHDLKTEPWGQKTFRFFDPDHHLIEVGESLNTFITRIFNETGSVKIVTEKTGVSEKLVKKIIGN